jgi:uncharacterized metal-binding protein
MPSGKVHNASTLATMSGVVISPLIFTFGHPISYFFGMATNLMVSPDLDVDGGNISFSYLRKVFPPLELAWMVFWWPYRVLLPHRSFWSHFPFISTMIRLGYIFLWVNLFIWIIRGILISLGFSPILPEYLFFWDWSFYIGLCQADIIHWAMDNTIKFREMNEYTPDHKGAK